MWQREHIKVYPNLTLDAIWRIWTDVAAWPKWHDDLDFCTMTGPFEAGNFFMLKPKGMGAVKIVLVDVKEKHFFKDCTTFWGAKMYDTHIMEQVPEGIRLTNKLQVTGPLSWLWVCLVARHVAETVPQEMDLLAKLAREVA